MKFSPRIIAAVVMGILLSSLAFVSWYPREPSLRGKALGTWIEQYYHTRTIRGSPQDASATEAREAVLEIGTNAIPTLLARVRTRDSGIQKRLLLWLYQRNLIQASQPKSELARNRADWGFAILGQVGEPAVPELVAALKDEDPGVRATAARCLGHIGERAESAIPALLPLLEERNQGIPILSAMDALRSIRGRPDLVIPAMVEYLSGDRMSWNYSVPAMSVLRAYGADAAPAIPAIKAYLRHPDSDKRNGADSALTFIEEQVKLKASSSASAQQ
ncbi:MAG TPA: HEAT repeat domain-containing protein [Verrucomicrobiota bacterium]|nr:HEAT repeat domain-containing protein [Verrucomicrobiota bacterium]